MKAPHFTQQFRVYVDGGTHLLGNADVTMPNFEALSETITGAGIMGELQVPGIGHFGALSVVMNFTSLMDGLTRFAVGIPNNFDLRSAQSFEETTTFERGMQKERFSFRGPVLSINPGTRAPNAPWAASMSVAVRRAEHFIDGRQVLEYDLINNIYVVNGRDIYAMVRAALM
jgi:hypothetical protein